MGLHRASPLTFRLSQVSVLHLPLSPQPPTSSPTSSFSVDDLLTSLRQQSNSKRAPIEPLPSHLPATGLCAQAVCLPSAVTHGPSMPHPKASFSALTLHSVPSHQCSQQSSVPDTKHSNSTLIHGYFSHLKKYFSWPYIFHQPIFFSPSQKKKKKKLERGVYTHYCTCVSSCPLSNASQ